MDIADRLRRPLISHAPASAIPDAQLRRMLVDDRSDALVEIVRLRHALRRIADGVEVVQERGHTEMVPVEDPEAIAREALKE